MLPEKLQIIGEGNVAYHLAKGFSLISEIQQINILSRHRRNKDLFLSISDKVNCHDLEEFDLETPVTFIVVSDDAIPEIAEYFRNYHYFILHTSGSTGTAIFKDLGYRNFGSFYPLQTFSLNKEVNWKEIPIFVNSNNDSNDQSIKELALQLSDITQVVSDDQRLNIHIGAVIVNNFVNHLFSLSESWLNKNDLDFNIMMPLIRETINKIESISPAKAQTGPAMRDDKKIIQRHIYALSANPNLQNIYSMISKSITKQYF